MVWYEPADLRKEERRVDAAIALAAACHMSDAKWRKLLGALRALGVGPLQWKFVRCERVFEAPVPPAYGLLERTLGDVPPYPYGPYREIEWVAIPADRTEEVTEALDSLGRFPVERTDMGVRVVGYTW